MEQKRNISVYSAAAIAFSLSLFLYIVVRAITVGFTHDESCTLFNYVMMPKKHGVLSLLNPCTANHFLNTFLMVPFYYSFGFNEFTLRLPSVLSYVVYLFAAYAISFRLKNKGMALACFLLLNLNLYLLDFFSLARGYGLAIAFMLVSFYYLLRFADKNIDEVNRKDILKILLPAALSVTANLVYLYYFLSAAAILFLWYFFSIVKTERKISWSTATRFFRFKLVSFTLFVLALFFVFLLPMLIIMHFKADTFSNFWGTQGLWQDTFRSLISVSLYGKQYFAGLIPLIGCVIGVLVFFSVVINIRETFKLHIIADYLFPTTAFLLIILQNLLQFKLMGTCFLVERMALIYYPFIILLFIYSLHYLGFFGLVWRFLSFITVIVSAGLLLFHFINAMNFTSAYSLGFDVNTRTMLKDLERHIESHNIKKDKISLGLIGCFKPGADFYREKYNYHHWLKPLIRDDSLTLNTYDYYYVWAEEAHSTTTINIPPCDTIKRYDDLKTLLLRKR